MNKQYLEASQLVLGFLSERDPNIHRLIKKKFFFFLLKLLLNHAK